MSSEINLPNNVLIGRYLKHFYDIPTYCPYGKRGFARYRQAQFSFVDDALMNAFLASGFRRNGNTIYTMACPDCDACRSLRLDPLIFKPNRSQKRVLQKCEHVKSMVLPLEFSKEKMDLLDQFFKSRFAKQDNNAANYYGTFFANSITETYEIEYKLEGELIGVAIVDVGTRWLNAVYFYFDERFNHLSPGVFNILHLLDLCRKQEINHLYLGYAIAGHGPMVYKTRFQPHELFFNDTWHSSGSAAS
jgi:arginyl-tRNA--protein-N-Asp/Glu arginylyltransferase